MRGLHIPFTRMGAVTSVDLFEEREQVLFDFYERNAGKYHRVLDIGANLGIHSILMSRAGWQVTAYEPDPKHFARLQENLLSHDCYTEPNNVVAINAAVSTRDGYATFVRVLGNETANHLAGARAHHGAVEKMMVPTIDCRSIFSWADFAKIDCEGYEDELLRTVGPETRCEFMVEVGTAENARRIFEHFKGWRQMWQQRTGWGEVRYAEDMPTHYSHGALFIGEKP